jgi:hypothetical protein
VLAESKRRPHTPPRVTAAATAPREPAAQPQPEPSRPAPTPGAHAQPQRHRGTVPTTPQATRPLTYLRRQSANRSTTVRKEAPRGLRPPQGAVSPCPPGGERLAGPTTVWQAQAGHKWRTGQADTNHDQKSASNTAATPKRKKDGDGPLSLVGGCDGASGWRPHRQAGPAATRVNPRSTDRLVSCDHWSSFDQPPSSHTGRGWCRRPDSSRGRRRR